MKIQPITDEEMDGIRQRTGGAVAEQVNRRLKLGRYADKKRGVYTPPPSVKLRSGSLLMLLADYDIGTVPSLSGD